MIVPETETAFVHIPKTAGTSICLALLKNINVGHFYYKRLQSRLSTLPAQIKNKYWLEGTDVRHGAASMYPDEYYTFTVVRNPIDRIISAHASADTDLSLLSFLEEHLAKKSVFVQPMVEFIDKPIDDIFYYEKLWEVEDKLGISLRQHNKTGPDKTKPWRHYKAPNKRRVAKHIKQKYKEDFLRFNYEL